LFGTIYIIACNGAEDNMPINGKESEETEESEESEDIQI
jgi:hypothetical protein